MNFSYYERIPDTVIACEYDGTSDSVEVIKKFSPFPIEVEEGVLYINMEEGRMYAKPGYYVVCDKTGVFTLSSHVFHSRYRKILEDKLYGVKSNPYKGLEEVYKKKFGMK